MKDVVREDELSSNRHLERNPFFLGGGEIFLEEVIEMRSLRQEECRSRRRLALLPSKE